MFALWRWWSMQRRFARQERLQHLAAQMDELLLTAKLAPDTRQQLQAGREQLEQQIVALRLA